MTSHQARLAAVEERQLRPIYEALDTNNIKSALTQVNKLLKKYPTPSPNTKPSHPPSQATSSRQLLTALKILALVRANKLDEASTLTTALLAETPTDENVLSTLAHSLKPLDRPKELVGMWTEAWNVETRSIEEYKKKAKSSKGSQLAQIEREITERTSRSEELGAQAFMAMVRTGYWAQAQTTSFKLYRGALAKHHSEGGVGSLGIGGDGKSVDAVAARYLYWSAISAVMQSIWPVPPPPVPVLVMIPPPPAVQEYEELRKKEIEEDKKLFEAAGLSVDADLDPSPSRRKKRAFALSLAKRLIGMGLSTEGLEMSGTLTSERFWLYTDVLKRVADATLEDEKAGLAQPTLKTAEEHYQLASSLFHNPAGIRLTESSLHVEELRAEVARLAGDWKSECEGMGGRLIKGDRNWKTFTTFLDSLFQFLGKETANPESYPCHTVYELPDGTIVESLTSTHPNGTDEKAITEGEENKTTEEGEHKTNGVEEKKGVERKEPFTRTYTRLFLTGLAEKDDGAQRGGERAGALGLIEFERRVRKVEALSGKNEDAPDYVGLLVKYFEIFGSKPVVVEDMTPYLLELEEGGDERGQWDAFFGSIDLATDNLKSLQTTINVLKLQRLLTPIASITPESEIEYAKKCTNLYYAALPLGKDLKETELQPADDLAVLTATALIHAHYLSPQSTATNESHAPLLNALVLLEQAASRSRWAYTHRLLLVRLYRLLGAASLAHQHYGLANLKSIQFDTLSHHILSRASTFSLGCVGDLTLVNECVESSQIYSVHGVETSEQLVKAFQWERYSQIAEFVLLEEKIDNSLQRDLTKLEHFRMKNLHEGLTPETVEVELVELRFVWARTHHDNRDFDLLPSYQPNGAIAVEDLTSVGRKRVSKKWFNTMLKMWIIILHLASEQIWTAEEHTTILPQLLSYAETDMEDLTPAERLWIRYSLTLLKWLGPHHGPIKHSVMTNAVSILAAAKAKHAQSSSTTPLPAKGKSNTGRKANGLSNGTEGTASGASASDGIGVKVGDVKVITGMLTLQEPMEVPPLPPHLPEAVKEPPTELDSLLDELQTLFDETVAKPTSLPWESLHVAQVAHEVTFVTHLLTARFSLTSSKKKAHPTYKPLRANSLSMLEHIAKGITTLAEETDFNAETRKSWLQDRRSSGVLDEWTDEQITVVGRGLYESRKKMLEGLGKGLTKAQQNIAKAAAGVPAGTI